jgi:hypothetical protein
MSDVDVDGAYEWLIVVVGIVFGIMSSYPDIFWSDTETTSASLQAVRSVVIPLVISAVLWVIGKLLLYSNRKILVKIVAWMYSVSITSAIFLTYLMEARFLHIQNENIQAGLSYFTLFILSPVFVYSVVLPRYRDKYPDTPFFKNNYWFGVALAIFILLIIVLIYFSSQV